MSPKTLARTTGAVSLLVLLGGIVAQGFIASGLIVSGDAAATATNILAHQRLYAFGFTVYMIEMAAQVAMTVLFYVLLRPVDRTTALLALSFGLVGATIKTLSRAFYYAPLLILPGVTYLTSFDTGQLQALSLLLVRINDRIGGIALIFLGIGTSFQGYLIFTSTFLPRWLGVIAMVGGLGWLAYLYPPLGSVLFYFVAVFAILGMVVTSVWLIVRGVDEHRWRDQAASLPQGAYTSRVPAPSNR